MVVNNRNIITGILMLVNMLLLFFMEGSSVLFSFAYTVILFLAISFLIKAKGDDLYRNFLLLNTYVVFSLILYYVQLSGMPDFIGFSGRGGGVGTDDCRFYNFVVDSEIILPDHCRANDLSSHPFVIMLNFLYPFKVTHPLHVIIPNLLGATFIPYFTMKLALKLGMDEKHSKLLFFLVAFIPNVLAEALILMRDSWTAMLFVASLYYVLKRKVISLLIAFSLLSYLRLSAGILLVANALFFVDYFLHNTIKKKKYYNYLIGIGIALLAIIAMLPVVMNYLQAMGVSFYRAEFIAKYYKNAGEGIFYTINQLPILLRLPVSFFFFFFGPFLKFQFYTEGILNIRVILTTTLFPLMFIALSRRLFMGFCYTFIEKKKDFIKLFYILILDVFVLSQMSMQFRHKLLVMPIIFIFIVLGFSKMESRYVKMIGYLGFGLVFIVNIISLLV